MAPILINSAEAMARIKVLTVKDDLARTLDILQNIGVVHVEENSDLQPVDRAAIDQSHREVNELHTYVNRVLGFVSDVAPIDIADDIEVIYTRPFSEISDEIKQIFNRTNRLQDKIVIIDDEIVALKETISHLGPLAESSNVKLIDLHFDGRRLFSRVIVIDSESYNDFSKSAGSIITENINVTADNVTVLHIVGDVRNKERLEFIVGTYGGSIPVIPNENISLREFLDTGTARLTKLEDDKTNLVTELNTLVGDDKKKLALLREALASENDRLSVLEKAGEAKYISVIEGWIPQQSVESATGEIKEEIPYVYIDVRDPEPEEEPPTEYKNPQGFKPFQIIVNLFSIPKYREWDPTPIVAYSFAFFFGLMVCDVLYAIGIMLLARFLLDKFVDDPTTEGVKQFKRLLYICAGVALVGGLLTGQYFANIYEFVGLENVALSKAVQEVLQDPVTFIVLALGIGFIHINIGHILGFIKGIKDRDKSVIVNKIGICCIQLGIPSILHGIMGVDVPGFTEATYSALVWVMLGGVGLVIVSTVMSSGGLGAIMWLFDVTGILGDIMSYARLAGVGLATYYLASTFNLMADIFVDMMGDGIGMVFGIILAVVVVVFGHVVNLILTTIGGFMHSLRLCFVEFLFKFYVGGGTEYDPFRFRKRTKVSLSIK